MANEKYSNISRLNEVCKNYDQTKEKVMGNKFKEEALGHIYMATFEAQQEADKNKKSDFYWDIIDDSHIFYASSILKDGRIGLIQEEVIAKINEAKSDYKHIQSLETTKIPEINNQIKMINTLEQNKNYDINDLYKLIKSIIESIVMKKERIENIKKENANSFFTSDESNNQKKHNCSETEKFNPTNNL